MRRFTWNRPRLFGGLGRTLLPEGGHARRADSRSDSESDTEIGMFVGGSTFVGYGDIADGTVRLRIKRGLSGFVSLFVSVGGDVRGVTEALVRHDGTLVVDAREAQRDVLAFLAPYGAQRIEIRDEGRLAPDAASQWMASLARRGFMEPPKHGPIAGRDAMGGAD